VCRERFVRVLVTVGRIGRAHGLKGEVGVDVRTDEPDRRFAEGATVVTDSKVPRTLTVAADDKEFEVTVRIDTPKEQRYYRHGGILQYVLRELLH